MGFFKKGSDAFIDFASGVFKYFEYIDTQKTINVVSYLYRSEAEGADKKNSIGLKLDNGKNLYGVKLETYSNAQVDFDNFDQLKKQFRHSVDAKMMLCYVKNGDFQAIYILTTYERIAIEISNFYRVKRLTGSGVMEALFDIYMVNSSVIYEKRQTSIYKRGLEDGIIDGEIDVMYKNFPYFITTGVRKIIDNYRFYQGWKLFPKEDRNINLVFRLPWNGCIFFMIDLYQKSPLQVIRSNMSRAQFHDKFVYADLKKVEQSIVGNQLDSVVINVSAFLDNASVLTSLSNELGVDFVENLINHQKILTKLPLFVRDSYFDMLLEATQIPDLVTSVHKKPVVESKEGNKIIPDIYGTDINGAFVSYFFSEFTNGHYFIFAKTRTGKSVFLQKMVTQIIGFDIKNMTVSDLYHKKIRYFDVGESGIQTSYALKKCAPLDLRDKIIISEEDGDSFRYSLFDFTKGSDGQPIKGEVAFAISFISLILDVNGEAGLTAGESTLISRVIGELYADGNYTFLMLDELESYGYKNIVIDLYDIKDEAGEQKYNGNTRTNEIDEDGYDFLKVPTLRDVIDSISSMSSKPETTSNVREDIHSCVKKMETLVGLEIYNYYSNNILIECQYFYKDFLRLKQDNEKMFVQLFWIVYKIYFKMDTENSLLERREGKRITPKFYILEEVHGFFKYDRFADMLKTAIREAAKAGIRLGFVSQNIDDIPIGILKNISTKIVLTSPENKQVERGDIEKYITDDPRQMNVYDQTTEYMATIFGENGAFGMHQGIIKEELDVFQTSG